MSSPDRVSRFGLVMAVALLSSACSVQPLYQNTASIDGTRTDVVADLASVSIKPVRQRYAQEVRNRLIYLFNHGAGQPAASRFALDLTVTSLNESAAVVQVAEENEPTAGTITLTGYYVLTDTASGEAIAKGSRSIASAYDNPRQEFAALRAQRDAENRAARELAELLRIVIAQDLARYSATLPVALK